MTIEEKLKHCVGCRQNFYNQPGNSTSGRCWMLDDMKVVLRKAVHLDQRPPWNNKPAMYPNCYSKPGHVMVAPRTTC